MPLYRLGFGADGWGSIRIELLLKGRKMFEIREEMLVSVVYGHLVITRMTALVCRYCGTVIAADIVTDILPLY